MLLSGFKSILSLSCLSEHVQHIMHRAVAFKVIVCGGLIDSSLSWSLREWKRNNPSNCVCSIIPQPIYLLVLGFYSINTEITPLPADSFKIKTFSVFIVIKSNI